MTPWYKIVTPREDLRSGRPLDTAEFAVHLQHVRDGNAPKEYTDPATFFERTFMTKTLSNLIGQVLRRLSGETHESNAVFNLSTQFGGGKTHALTALFHLARAGSAANNWYGVPRLLGEANLSSVPLAKTAIFVGTEFDSVKGRGGDDGTPKRRTPWGEIAFQLGGNAGFEVVAEHDARGQSPGGDVLSALIPSDQPTLILLDELMNFMSRERRSGMGAQLYNFLQNLSEFARGRTNVVLAVSVPASELEMNSDDQADFERIKKLLDRVGKAMVMSAESEIPEIIRRRLFDWKGSVPREAQPVITEYAAWLTEHRNHLEGWFKFEDARGVLEACYPFHPSLLSVFERKWQALPRFQQTRGVLRLLATWVSHAYRDGYNKVHADALIGLGTAPLGDPTFRAALFEQLGETRLEAAVTTDIDGEEFAHAKRLDAEAVEAVKRARLHQKIATVVLFESNGGQTRSEATTPEISLAVGEPGVDLGHVGTCLDALSQTCYYLVAERARSFKFTFLPNLNKLLNDKRSMVSEAEIGERVRAAVTKVVSASRASLPTPPILFPSRSNDIPDRPCLAFVVLGPEQTANDATTLRFIKNLLGENGASARANRNGLIFLVADSSSAMVGEARKLLAWQAVLDEAPHLKLDEAQRSQVKEGVRRAERDLDEAVWRAYRFVYALSPENELQQTDLGMQHSSSAVSLMASVLTHLKSDDSVVERLSPAKITRNWPPAHERTWTLRSLRDTVYSSPRMPRLLNADTLRETIISGVRSGDFGYGTGAPSTPSRIVWKEALSPGDIAFDDDQFLIRRETVEALREPKPTRHPEPHDTDQTHPQPRASAGYRVVGTDESDAVSGGDTEAPSSQSEPRFEWTGDIPPQKWVNFYTRVVAKLAGYPELKLRVTIEVEPEGGIPSAKIHEANAALKDMGLKPR